MKVPQAQGHQSKITCTDDIFKEVRQLVANTSNLWSWTHHNTTHFRMRLPGMAKVHVGGAVFPVHRFFLEGQPAFQASNSGSWALQHTGVTDCSVHDINVNHSTQLFPQVLMLIKLRWLLKLHSALSEMDYKMASCRNLIQGVLYVIIQQYADVEADSGFDAKVSVLGADLNIGAVIDDLVEQLHRSLGASWRAFIEYVATCDGRRSLMVSTTDLAPPKVVSTGSLWTMIDEIFLAYVLKQSRDSVRLTELFQDLEAFHVTPPEIPEVRIDALKEWAKATTFVTKKEKQKAAQLQAVHLVAAMELGRPGCDAPMDAMDEAMLSSLTSIQNGRLVTKPHRKLEKEMAMIVTRICSSHHTFPVGIRERLFHILGNDYALSTEQRLRVEVSMIQNLDDKRLSEAKLYSIEHHERNRLRDYSANNAKETSYLMKPSLVGMPEEKGKPPLYSRKVEHPERRLHQSAYYGEDMTRSLPDLRGNTSKDIHQRSTFKVPLQTGPLVLDPDLGKLHTTGLFMKMKPVDAPVRYNAMSRHKFSAI